MPFVLSVLESLKAAPGVSSPISSEAENITVLGVGRVVVS